MEAPDYAALFASRMNDLCWSVTGGDSPADLAAELRLKERNVQRYMAGETQPLLREAVKIATRAGVSLDWLAGLSADGGPAAPVPTETPPGTPPSEGPQRPRRAKRSDNGSRRRSS
jgi:hypothetical protein